MQDTKEWKERGRGDFKILKNPTTGKARFLMRREQVFLHSLLHCIFKFVWINYSDFFQINTIVPQVLKVCCNHVVSKELEIKPQGSSDRAWTWTAADFSEGEVKNELLALRFKTCETAAAWKAVVDKVQAEASTETPKEEKKEQGSKVEETGKGVSLAQFASAQKAGKWECGACLTSNPEERIQCLACEGARPGKEEEVAKGRPQKKNTELFGNFSQHRGGGVSSIPKLLL